MIVERKSRSRNGAIYRDARDFILHAIEMEIISQNRCDAKNVLLLCAGCPFAHCCWLCTRKVISVSHIVCVLFTVACLLIHSFHSRTHAVSLPFFFCSNFSCLYKYALCKRSTHSDEEKKMLIDNSVRYFFCFRSHCASKIVIALWSRFAISFEFIYLFMWFNGFYFTISLFHSFTTFGMLAHKCAGWWWESFFFKIEEIFHFNIVKHVLYLKQLTLFLLHHRHHHHHLHHLDEMQAQLINE